MQCNAGQSFDLHLIFGRHSGDDIIDTLSIRHKVVIEGLPPRKSVNISTITYNLLLFVEVATLRPNQGLPSEEWP